MDGRGQPPLIVVPNHLADFADHLLDRRKCAGPVDLRFEPFPAALNRIILRRIGLQMFQDYPVMLLHEAFHQVTFVNLGIVEDQENERLRKTLMELVEKLDEELRRAPRCSFPIHLLGAEMQGPKQSRTLPLGRTRHFGLFPLAKPAALHIGFIGPMRLIGKEHFDTLSTAQFLDGVDDLCHPLFFCSVLGALRGRVLAKRL